MAAETGTRSKVTLTNWVRLTNAPLLLPCSSAVQWNEYVFLLTRDGTALLYHTKHGVWSVLPKCPNQLHESMSVVNYKGQVIVVTRYNQLLAFDVSSSKWKERTDLAIKPKPHSISLAVDNDKLFACTVISTSTGYFRSSTVNFSELSEDGWKPIDVLTHKKDLSYARFTLLAEHHFIQTSNGEIYKHPREKEQTTANQESEEKIPEMTPPPYTDCTFHVVKDTLFAFGGRDEDNQPTSDLLRYNPDTDSWESAGYMRSARYNVAVVTVQQDGVYTIHVLGGSYGNTRLEMKPKVLTEAATEVKEHWECSTCVAEKCTVE